MTVWCPEAHNMTTQISHIETKTASSFRHHPSYIFILHFLATPPCQLSLIGISALMASLAKSSASISLDSGSRHFFYHSKWNSHHLNSIKKLKHFRKKIVVYPCWSFMIFLAVQHGSTQKWGTQHGPTWWWHHLGMGHGTLVPLNPKS